MVAGSAAVESIGTVLSQWAEATRIACGRGNRAA